MKETNIFISYRRTDSAGHAGRIYDKLYQQFGEAQVFLDFNAIPGATDFRKEIREALRKANIVLVIIGPHWLNSTNEQGQRRLMNDRDLVRREIRTALDGDVTVIPVLVGGAHMPQETELPEDLIGLCQRNAIEISNNRFREDCDRLIKEIGLVTHEESTPTIESEIRPGWWSITKSNYGLAPVSIILELKRDGSVQGRLGNMGALGQIIQAFDTDGFASSLFGQVNYSGQWSYDVSSKILILQLMGQVSMYGGGAETWKMQIIGNVRGVYQARGFNMDNFEIKRIG